MIDKPVFERKIIKKQLDMMLKVPDKIFGNKETSYEETGNDQPSDYKTKVWRLSISLRWPRNHAQ